MNKRPLMIIVLAAGRGTRMGSTLPKVMQPLQGKAMIHHLLDTLAELQAETTLVVVGKNMAELEAAVAPHSTVVQQEPLGTGDAVKAARGHLQNFTGDVLVVYGDTPLISAKTLKAMIAARESQPEPAVVVLGFRPQDPKQYGRLLASPEGELLAIVEYLEASEGLRHSNLCNSGVMGFDGKHLLPLLDAIDNQNAKGEYYLTDVVGIARQAGLNCRFIEGREEEVLGINTQSELAALEQQLASA